MRIGFSFYIPFLRIRHSYRRTTSWCDDQRKRFRLLLLKSVKSMQIRQWITVADTELYVRVKRWWSWARLTDSPRTVHSFLKTKRSGVPFSGFFLRVSIIRVIPNCATPELPAQGSRTLNSATERKRCFARTLLARSIPPRRRRAVQDSFVQFGKKKKKKHFVRYQRIEERGGWGEGCLLSNSETLFAADEWMFPSATIFSTRVEDWIQTGRFYKSCMRFQRRSQRDLYFGYSVILPFGLFGTRPCFLIVIDGVFKMDSSNDFKR